MTFPPLLVGLAVALALLAPLSLGGQSTSPGAVRPATEDPPEITRAEGARFLAEFRRARVQGDFALRFDLVHLPRQGRESRLTGELWGSHNAIGPVLRVALPGSGVSLQPTAWLLQNGRVGGLWQAAPGDAVGTPVPTSQWLTPIRPPLVYTLFDVQMPFVYWPQATYEGTARILGRPAHRYYFSAPAEFREAWPELAAVRASLDATYYALLRADAVDERGRVLRSLRVNSFKKVQEQWMVKSIDVLDLTTRDRSRFLVREAALGLDLGAGLFTPGDLGRTPPLLPIEAWATVD